MYLKLLSTSPQRETGPRQEGNGFTRMENLDWVVLVEATFRDLTADGPHDYLSGLLNGATALMDGVDYEDLSRARRASSKTDMGMSSSRL